MQRTSVNHSVKAAFLVLAASIAAAAIATILFSCSKPKATNTAQHAASGLIGPAGGTVAVADPNSPIYGAEIVVPAGALASSVELFIDVYGQTMPIPTGLTAAGVPVEFGPDGTMFLTPVQITLPLSANFVSGSTAVVFEFSPDIQVWTALPSSNPDTTTKRIVAATFHFSPHQILSIPPGQRPSIDTGFRVGTDNLDDWNTLDGGVCNGNSVFALWWWQHKKKLPNCGLFAAYSQVVAGLIAQAVQNCVPPQEEGVSLDANTAWLSLAAGQPFLMNMVGLGPDGKRIDHAVLVTGYDKASNSFVIYDPNIPTAAQSLSVTSSGGLSNYYYTGGYCFSKFSAAGTPYDDSCAQKVFNANAPQCPDDDDDTACTNAKAQKCDRDAVTTLQKTCLPGCITPNFCQADLLMANCWSVYAAAVAACGVQYSCAVFINYGQCVESCMTAESGCLQPTLGDCDDDTAPPQPGQAVAKICVKNGTACVGSCPT
jgi:hypothetical protein